MTSIEATSARDELVDLTLAPIPVGERPSRWAVQTAQQAIAYAATQDAVELAYLLDLVKREEPMTILEIGTWLGGTLWAWGQAAPEDAFLISVDRDQSQRRMGRGGQTLVMIEGDSQDSRTRDRVADAAAPDGVDFLFIDADHRLAGVTRDHDLYAPLVRPGGIVAFHDVAMTNPEHVVPEERVEVYDLWVHLASVAAEAWEWSVCGDRFGIGAYRKEPAA